MGKKIVAIVASYRKGGVIDTAIDEVLAASNMGGADTEKIYLIDHHLKFCTNCRTCTQTAGTTHGQCVHKDGLDEILTKIDSADALIIGSPVNCFNITAIGRQFMERLICYSYWPWGKAVAPKPRNNVPTKQAILITSAAMPSFLQPIMTGAPRALKLIAGSLGAKPIRTLSLGMLKMKPGTTLSAGQKKKAHDAGQMLAI